MFLDAVVDATKYPNIGSQLNVQKLLNRIMRLVWAEVDIKTAKRKATAIQMFDDEYDYTLPSDLKGWGIVDIKPQKPRTLSEQYRLVQNEDFDRKKSLGGNLVTIYHADNQDTLRFTGDTDDETLTVSGLSSLSDGGGTWAAFSAGSSGVVADNSNYIEGGGSISFDLVGGTTTAGIVNTTITAVDISDYVADGTAFLWVYLTATTNITNVKLRIGSDASNYHELTETTQYDGSAFVAGWNLIGFDFLNTSDTGTPTDTATDYVAVYLTKSSGQTGTNFRFDYLRIHTGEYASVVYYSAFPWATTAAGTTRIENSTTAADYLVAVTDEMPVIEAVGRREFYKELREWDMYKIAAQEAETEKLKYKRRYPTERMKIQSNYY